MFALRCPEGWVTVCQSIMCKIAGDLNLYRLCSQNLKPHKFYIPSSWKRRKHLRKEVRFNDYFVSLPLTALWVDIFRLLSLKRNYWNVKKGTYNFTFHFIRAWPPLWSSGQSFWLQIQKSRVRFPALPDFLSSSGSGTGSTQPHDVNWGATWIKSSGSGPENRD